MMSLTVVPLLLFHFFVTDLGANTKLREKLCPVLADACSEKLLEPEEILPELTPVIEEVEAFSVFHFLQQQFSQKISDQQQLLQFLEKLAASAEQLHTSQQVYAQMFQVLAEMKAHQDKISICQSKCPADWRRDTEIAIKLLNARMQMLQMQYPLLASENFLQLITANLQRFNHAPSVAQQQQIMNEIMKKFSSLWQTEVANLRQSTARMLATWQEQQKRLAYLQGRNSTNRSSKRKRSGLQSPRHLPLVNNQNAHMVLEVLENLDGAELAAFSSGQRQRLCQLWDQATGISNSQLGIRNSLRGAMIALPFLAGGISATTKALASLPRAYQWVIQGSVYLGIEGGLLAFELQEIHQQKNNCQQLKVRQIRGEGQLAGEVEECFAELEAMIFWAQVGGTLAVVGAPLTSELLSKLKTIKHLHGKHLLRRPAFAKVASMVEQEFTDPLAKKHLLELVGDLYTQGIKEEKILQQLEDFLKKSGKTLCHK